MRTWCELTEARLKRCSPRPCSSPRRSARLGATARSMADRLARPPPSSLGGTGDTGRRGGQGGPTHDAHEHSGASGTPCSCIGTCHSSASAPLALAHADPAPALRPASLRSALAVDSLFLPTLPFPVSFARPPPQSA